MYQLTFQIFQLEPIIPVLEYTLSGQVCTEVGTSITAEPASAVTASGGVSN
jgi:hypothetical protein